MKFFFGEQLEPIWREAAVKLLKKNFLQDGKLSERFRAEAQALSRLDHLNIARLYEAGMTDDGRPYMAMELITGTPITEWCDARDFSLEERVNLIQKICEAMQHAHDQGFVHRDLKPENLLVELESGEPKVIDFGVARSTFSSLEKDALLTGTLDVLGTPAYLSPEQTDGDSRKLDGRSDIYSLGVVLFELCTGKTPFALSEVGESQFEVLRVVREEKPPIASSVNAEVSLDLERAIGKALAKKPEDRFGSMNEFRRALREIDFSKRREESRSWLSRLRWIWAIGLLLLLLGFAGWHFGQSDNEIRDETVVGGVERNHEQDRIDILDGHWGVCYSGYRRGQHPDLGQGARNPSRQEVTEDLRILEEAGFQLLRLNRSCEVAEMVLEIIETEGLELSIMLGAWLDAEVNNPDCPWQTVPFSEEELMDRKKRNVEEIHRLIRFANDYPEIVAAVSVGDEALSHWTDHLVPEKRVMEYVDRVKKAVEQPVTVVENYVWWTEKGGALAERLDFVSVNLYPLWEGHRVESSMIVGTSLFEDVQMKLPDAKFLLAGVGWATSSIEHGEIASEEAQVRYFEEMKAWSLDQETTTFFFEAFDQTWKGDPYNKGGMEKHWGLFDVDRQPKKAMRQK